MTTLTPSGRNDAPVGRTATARHVDRLRALAGRVVGRITHELSAWRTARHLARLDNRMLQDIGLRRIGSTYFPHSGSDHVTRNTRTRRFHTAWNDSDDASMPVRATAKTMEMSA